MRPTQCSRLVLRQNAGQMSKAHDMTYEYPRGGEDMYINCLPKGRAGYTVGLPLLTMERCRHWSEYDMCSAFRLSHPS